MDTVYQVQFRTNKNPVWRTYNMEGSAYDITHSLEKAKRTLEKAKDWHLKLNTNDEKYEYRIAKVTYSVEYI